MFGKLIRINKEDFVAFGGVLGGVFLLIQLILTVVMLTLFPCDAVMVSGMLLMVLGAVLAVFAAVGQVLITFEQGVRFGLPRRQALGMTAGLICVESLFLTGVCILLQLVERYLSPRWWMLLTGAQGYSITAGSGIPVVQVGDPAGVHLWIDSFMSVAWWVPAVVIGCAGLLGFVVGALMQRYGRMGGWLVWGVWMAFCVVFPQLPWRTHTVVDWLFPGTGAVALAALVWSVWSLLHAVIRE